MTIMKTFYDYSQLSMASYSTKIGTLSFGDALIDSSAGFVQAQADQLISEGWEVVRQSSDAVYGSSGFSATLFKNTQTGEYVFANRGTAGFTDLAFADVWGIVIQGMAGSQIIDMYRFYKQLITSQGQHVVYSADELFFLNTIKNVYSNSVLGSVSDIINLTQNDLGVGGLSANQAFTTTGHSLGGHLSLWLDKLVPAVSHVYTYNGAGNGGFFQSAVTTVSGTLMGTPFSLSPDSGTTNVFGYGGPAIISGVGGNVGANIPVDIEFKDPIDSVLSGLYNHSIVQLTDAMAVVNLFNKLDAGITTERFNDLFLKGSNEIGLSLEGLLDGLRSFFGKTDSTPNDNRDQFYINLYDLQNSDAYQSLIGKFTLTAPPTTASEARNDFGAFLSLIYLTPFALKANDITVSVLLETLNLTNTELALKWEQDKTLTPEQLAGSAANYSDIWLADRAAMLSWQNKLNAQDIDATAMNPYIANAASQHFKDITSGKEIFINGLVVESQDFIFGSNTQADVITGHNRDDHLYGGAGNDILSGGKGNDLLEGGLDNDTLTGGEGNDIILGGAGTDTYVINSSDGFDTLLDTDGLGSIVKDGQTLSGGYQQGGSNTFTGKDAAGNDHAYILLDGDINAASGATLLIDGAIEVSHYHAGELGISLDGAVPPPLIDQTLVGNRNGQVDDYLAAWTVGKGNDIIEGRGGKDIIDGGLTGDDLLYSDSQITTEQAILNGNTDTGTGLQGDWLGGAAGNDTLVGSTGNDVLSGGSGSDLLIAGAGDDDILGDKDYVPQFQNWEAIGTVPDRSYIQLFLPVTSTDIQFYGSALVNMGTVATGQSDPADDAADIIYAGDGRDFILGGAGNDVIYGEGGNDYVYGNDGSDIMLGGSGDDTLIGDNGDGTGAEGNDYLNGGDGNDTLFGEGGNDILIGGTGHDQLYGGDGNDSLSSSGTGSSLFGGAGEDTLLVEGGGNNYLDGGEGRDWYVFDSGFGVNHITDSGAGGNGIQFNFNFADSGITIGLGSLKLSFANGDELHIDNFNPNDPLNSSSIDSFVFADRTLSLQDVLDLGINIIGTPNADLIQGVGLNERITALAGDDTIFAGAGNDIIGAGAGNDHVDGGTGSDAMSGGAGNDTYLVDNTGDVVNENLNEGIDLVQSSISYTLSDNVENLVLTPSTGSGQAPANLDGIGNALDNSITGNSGNNLLDGGLGADTLTGGAGNDTYIVDNTADVVVEQLSADTDSVFASADFTLSDNVENLTLTGTANIKGTGNVFGNSITGNDADNTLSGMAGNDMLRGGSGNDTLLDGAGNDELWGNGGNDILLGGAGNDLLNGDTAGIGAEGNDYLDGGDGNDRLWGDGGNDTLLGGAGDDKLSGNNGSDSLDGGSGNDKLWGNSGNDTLLGGAGSDMLSGDNGDGTGAEGNDYLDGGDGNDQLWGDGGDDTLLGGAGDDTLSGDVGNGTGVEGNDYLDGGNGNDDLWGNGGDDTLLGGLGDDYLEGQVGNDTLYGEAGNDHLWGEEGADSLYGGDGIDYLEGGDANDTLLGGADDDKITGDNGDGTGAEGNDYIDGGDGNDKLWGDGGNDTLLGGEGSDKLWGDVGDGTGAEGNDYLDAGNGNDKLWGEGGNDTLLGGAGDDILNGDSGNDNLVGDLGNDTLLGGAGDDRYVFRLGDGADTINDTQGNNTLIIGSDLTVNNLEASRADNDILLSIVGTTDSILLTNWFAQTEGVNRLELSDGSSLDRVGIEDLLNRPPVANADTITVYEDSGVMHVSAAALLANDTDPDANDVISLVAVGASVSGASVLLIPSAGSGQEVQVQYDIGNRFQELGAGQTIIDSFGYTISDSKGKTANSVVNVTIAGVNDAPETVADTAAVQEDLNITAIGNVLDNDNDVDQNTVLSVANFGVFTGSYGSLALAADGSYSYALGNASIAVQSLAAGQIVTETFDYQASDGLIVSPSTLSVTITGTNDAPVVAIPLADQTATENGIFDYQLPIDAFTDIDTGDQLSYDAMLTNGKPLPDWLVFDADSRTFHSIMQDGSAGLWDIRVTATDTFGAGASSTFRLDVANFINGTGEEDKLNGTALRDVMYGLADDDWLRGAAASDVLVGGSGNDVLEGGAGDDILIGGIPVDTTLAGAPVPVESDRHGKHDKDSHHDDEHGDRDKHDFDGEHNKSGNNLLNGGSGNDILIGGDRNDLLIGGTGNDTINAGTGADIIAFNRGDGQDIVLVSPTSTDSGQAFGNNKFTGGADNILSLGKGIKKSDLYFRHFGNDLILETGGSDRITFRDWYASPNKRSVDTLQMIGNTDSKASKARIDLYDFNKLVERFDKAVADHVATDHWALTNARLDKHLQQSKGEALGGDLTYQYGKNGSLAAVSLGAAQDVLDNSSFAVKTQDLHNLVGLKDGIARLS